ncbi:ATP-binding protein [Jannaschia sp. Os4]|uniref:AAA family ATPase n=1 Tax=Jannaschia sp. Os4 TaxID=2807617 RepID=UPI0019399B14|nr:ATP-binding protein [Jannaschia sp. Os4]MBM2576734.1 ATP-binding protein [Jannaschia sp. Os4]
MTALHGIGGLPGAGKSTLAARLAEAPATVRLSEDDLIAALYPGEVATMGDWLDRAARVRNVVRPQVADMLRAGVSVVLDFQANTVRSRRWMAGLAETAGASLVLHWLDVPEAECLARLTARNAAGAHPFAPTEAEFRQVASHVVPPAPEEGLTVEWHR